MGSSSSRRERPESGARGVTREVAPSATSPWEPLGSHGDHGTSLGWDTVPFPRADPGLGLDKRELGRGLERPGTGGGVPAVAEVGWMILTLPSIPNQSRIPGFCETKAGSGLC